MSASAGVLAVQRLRELARRELPAAAPAESARCDLCGDLLPPEHRHVLDLDSGEPQCACRACAVLFDRGGAGGSSYRLIPQRRLALEALRLDDRLFAALGIPVDLAFVTVSGRSGDIVARYPSPIGLTTATPAPDAWELVVEAEPALAELEPDVEALLVNRSRGARDQWLVPIDDCYLLAARVREHWHGFGGGDEVWDEIARFFAELRGEREEATWR